MALDANRRCVSNCLFFRVRLIEEATLFGGNLLARRAELALQRLLEQRFQVGVARTNSIEFILQVVDLLLQCVSRVHHPRIVLRGDLDGDVIQRLMCLHARYIEAA